MKSLLIVLWIAGILIMSGDSPPAYGDVKILSANKRFSAVSDIKARHTRVFSVSTGKNRLLWEIAGYCPSMFLSDNGSHLVVGQAEGNLLPADVKPEHQFLSFYATGKLIRSVQVGEVFPDLSKLPKSSSHLVWGNFSGFDRKGRFAIILFDGRQVAYDPSSGRLQR